MSSKLEPKAGAHSSQWQAIQFALDDAARVVFDDARIDSAVGTAEASRYLLRLTQFAREALVENHDPAYPFLMKCESPFLQWGFPNPDYVYWYAPVHGDYHYRLRGRRGSSRMFTAETWSGDWSQIGEQRILDCKVHVSDGTGELAIEPDGSFEIVLSRTPQAGNWLPIGEGFGTLLIRDCYYDWETESPTLFEIEREGALYPAPPMTAETLDRNLESLCALLRDAPRRLQKALALHYASPPNTIAFPDLEQGLGTDTGFPKQLYGRGHFRCTPDEAVLIEVKPPPCAFWGFQLGSQYWEAWDWHHRSMAINAHQAVLDADGVFRAVIAHRDPGVANWLDTAGHEHGTIGCRWNRPRIDNAAIVPRLRKVRFDQLHQVLPSGTRTVSAQERSALLDRRRRSIRRRGAG